MSGLSHMSQLNIATNDLALYEKEIAFYSKLGFKVLSNDLNTHVCHLHFYSHIGIHIKLALSKNEQSPTEINIIIDSLKDFKNYLSINNVVDSSLLDSPDSVTLKDPLQNTVTFLESHSFNPKNTAESPKVKTEDPTHIKSTSFSSIPQHLSAKNKKIGILTSGGDSCGMNAAVRSITRVALHKGCTPFAIYEGYQGLVDGGDKIKQLSWDSVRGYLAKGGTLIGTARCKDFRSREGRLKACYNLIKNGIDALVIIGGDGSLTGADTFRAEWCGLVDELVTQGKLTVDESKSLRNDLAIVGLVGSIDNDMSSTDITIGAVTSLHRICEAVDCLSSTAQSHQRAFVIEVMGRHCGWLALMAAIAVGADACFIPERPPPLNQEKYGYDWKKEMCDVVSKNRQYGNRKSLVIVCEGAIDRNLNPIKPDEVKKTLEDKLGLDTRVTTLGHVQRGGSTCAFDRYLATVQGVEAVDAVLRSSRDIPAPMIGMSQNKIISVPLMEAVKLTQSVSASIAKKDFAKAMELRDPDFTSAYDAYIASSLRAASESHSSTLLEENRIRVGILHVGAPAGGMNAATRIIARLCHSKGHLPIGIRNGFSGLVRDELSVLHWEDVRGWQVLGGSQLGSNRDHPSPIPGASIKKAYGISSYVETGAIAYHLQKHNIHALIIVGGFEGLSAQLTLTEGRSVYPALCIPMVHIPATISNNIPGTDYSIGSDTALNVIVAACDSIRLSANASRKRVFVVETHGGNCGYLATLSALTIGATASYIPEEGLSLETISSDVKHLIRRYTDEAKNNIMTEGRVILRAENTEPAVYSTAAIAGILRAEGKGLFDSRETVLGHLQQGDIPSPLDRIRATKLAVSCMEWLDDVIKEITPTEFMRTYTQSDKHSIIIGIRGATIVPTTMKDIMLESDMKMRRPKENWWMDLRGLIRVLGKREYHE